MNRFFVDNKTYKERLKICKSCEHYFKATGNCKICGCFMRVKASMSFMECPKQYWLKTKELKTPTEIPEHLKQEIKNIYPKIKDGVADSHETKAELIELYNVIYNTRYKKTTNCGTCLNSVYNGILNIYKKL